MPAALFIYSVMLCGINRIWRRFGTVLFNKHKGPSHTFPNVNVQKITTNLTCSCTQLSNCNSIPLYFWLSENCRNILFLLKNFCSKIKTIRLNIAILTKKWEKKFHFEIPQFAALVEKFQHVAPWAPSIQVYNQHQGRLSLPSLRGRWIEYRSIWLGLRRGEFTCVVWQMWNSIWQVMLRSSIGDRLPIHHLYNPRFRWTWITSHSRCCADCGVQTAVVLSNEEY